MSNAKYIDPIIGTVGDEQDTSLHGGGKTHPGACLPGGTVQLSPDTTAHTILDSYGSKGGV